MATRIIVLCLFAGGIAGCASTPPSSTANLPGTSDCMFQRDLRGWTVLDSSSFIIEASNGKPYLVKLFHPSPDMQTRETLAFQDGDRNGQICSTGDSLMVSGSIPEVVPIRAVRLLSAEEAQQLRAPKKPAV